MSEKRRVIILNGASSTGKSSIAKALQAILEEPIFHIEHDAFAALLPAGHLITTSHAEFRVRVAKLLFAVNRATLAMLEGGYDVIIDCVLARWDILRDYIELFQAYQVLFVGVHCSSPTELERREEARNSVGRGRKQMAWVHHHGVYDLEVDTSNRNPEACAQEIAAALLDPPQPTAFEQLWKMFASGEITGTFFRDEI